MPENKGLQAAPASLRTLIGREGWLHAPFFQRRFSWESSNLTQFLEDTEAISEAEGPNHFLGAVVLHQAKGPVGEDRAIYWIIDGQQRLTSVLLTMLALAQKVPDSVRIEEAFDKWMITEGQTKRIKLLPTYNDREQLKVILKIAGREDLVVSDSGGQPTGGLLKGWKSVSRWLDRYLARSSNTSEEKTKVAERYLDGLLNRVSIVEIVIPQEMDSTQIFQSINGKSRKLEVSDLIRSLVAMSFTTNQAREAETFFRDRWLPFESRVGLGNLGDLLFVYGLQSDEKPSKTALYEFLRSTWSKGGKNGEWTGKEIVDDLEKYVPAYRYLIAGDIPEAFEGRGAKDLRKTMVVVRNLDPSAVTRSYLVRLLYETQMGNVDLDTTIAALECVEGFLTRRALVNVEPTGLHALFKSLWTSAEGDPQGIVDEIQRRGSIHTPSDQEIIEALTTKRFYKNSKARFVLYEWERAQTKRRSEFQQLYQAGHLDHIMPRASDGEPEWHKVGTREEREKVVDLIGNLVLIESEENSSKGTEAWRQVVPRYQKESRAKAAQELLVREAVKDGKRTEVEVKSWTCATVRARSKRMAEWACKRWPDQFTK